MVKWDTITKCKEECGMGLRKTDQMNKVCGMKLVWKLLSGEEDLWCIVLKSKYKVSNMFDCTSRGTYFMLWKGITKLMP